jgi:formylglycine-generating enzyme required for sulfatase activity
VREAGALRGAKREPSTRSQIIGFRCARDAKK